MAYYKPVDDLELDAYDRMLAADMDSNSPLYADAQPSDDNLSAQRTDPEIAQAIKISPGSQTPVWELLY